MRRVGAAAARLRATVDATRTGVTAAPRPFGGAAAAIGCAAATTATATLATAAPVFRPRTRPTYRVWQRSAISGVAGRAISKDLRESRGLRAESRRPRRHEVGVVANRPARSR